MREELAEMAAEVNEKIRSQLFALARHPKVGIWVDANVMMYAKKEFKQELLGFSNLRSIPEVAIEVRKRAKKTSYLLDKFQESGGVLIGPDSFRSPISELYKFILSHAASYSPFTQSAIVENLKTNGSTSPIENNALENFTKDSDFLESALDAIEFTSALGVANEHNAECNKLRKSWFKYHREREQRVSAKSYLWTDEKLVASALTDGFAHNCVSIVLTTDWDPYVIIKQFVDNVIYQSVKIGMRCMDGTDAFETLYGDRCIAFNKQNAERRFHQSTAIIDGDLFGACERADLFIWHYPTEKFLSFSFPNEFKSWLSSIPQNPLEET
jgi:hypothetical protein